MDWRHTCLFFATRVKVTPQWPHLSSHDEKEKHTGRRWTSARFDSVTTVTAHIIINSPHTTSDVAELICQSRTWYGCQIISRAQHDFFLCARPPPLLFVFPYVYYARNQEESLLLIDFRAALGLSHFGEKRNQELVWWRIGNVDLARSDGCCQCHWQ